MQNVKSNSVRISTNVYTDRERARAADQCIHLHATHATQHRATSISVIQSVCVVCFSLRLSNGLVYYAAAAGSKLSQKERRALRAMRPSRRLIHCSLAARQTRAKSFVLSAKLAGLQALNLHPAVGSRFVNRIESEI
jgi:hypothetical protein